MTLHRGSFVVRRVRLDHRPRRHDRRRAGSQAGQGPRGVEEPQGSGALSLRTADLGPLARQT